MNFNDQCSLNPSLFKINIDKNSKLMENQANVRATININEQTIPLQINKNFIKNSHTQNASNHNQTQLNSAQNFQLPQFSQSFNYNNQTRLSSSEPQTEVLLTKLKGKMQNRNETNSNLVDTVSNLYKKNLEFVQGKLPSLMNINSLNNKPNQITNNNIVNSNASVNNFPASNIKNVYYYSNNSSSSNTPTSTSIPIPNISNKQNINSSQTPYNNKIFKIDNTHLNRKRQAEVPSGELENLLGNPQTINNEKITKNVDAAINRQKIEIQSKYEENNSNNTTRNIRADIKKEEFSQEKNEVVVLLENLQPQFDSNVITYTNKYVIEIKHKTKNIRYVLEVEKNSLNVIYNEKIMKDCSTNMQLNNATDFRTYIKNEIQSYL